jgi:hypothetical protein
MPNASACSTSIFFVDSFVSSQSTNDEVSEKPSSLCSATSSVVTVVTRVSIRAYFGAAISLSVAGPLKKGEVKFRSLTLRFSDLSVENQARTWTCNEPKG